MRTTLKLLGTGLLLVTVTACGARTDTGAGGAVGTAPAQPPTSAPGAPPVAPSPPTTGRPTQSVPPGDNAVAESQIDARGVPDGYPRNLTRSSDGRTLILQAEEGGCRHVTARVGDQTAQQVVVLVTVSTGKKGQMCRDYVREITIPLQLTDPLGTRTVVLRQG